MSCIIFFCILDHL